MATRFNPTFQALDSNGDPINGAQLFFYGTGTSSKLSTFSDRGLTTANTNPVVSDSAGRFGDIWLQAADYKVRFCAADAADPPASSIDDWDPIPGALIVSGDDYKPSQQSTADMTVLVAAGSFWDAPTGAIVSNAAQTSAVITAPTTNPRIDTIHINRRTGVIGITAGSEAASPTAPTLAAGLLPVANVTLATTTTEITDSLITDVRELEQLGLGTAAAVDTGTAAGEVPTNDQAYVDVASATTTDIGAAASENVRITGTTTITGLGTVDAGITRNVRFAGVLTLTHNATSLILKGGANITTAANDSATFISLGSGNWFCHEYERASGVAIAPPFTGISSIGVVRKTADETVNNSATLQNDDELVAAMAANEEALVYLHFSFDGNATADIKFDFTVPSGATFIFNYPVGIGVSAAGSVVAVNDQTAGASGLAPNGPGAGSRRIHTLVGFYSGGANAGNLQFQWAQSTADASNTTVKAGARMILFRE